MHDDGYRPGTAREEAARAFELVFPIVEHAGFARGDVVHVDLAFADLDDLPEVDALYGELLDEPPARAIYRADARGLTPPSRARTPRRSIPSPRPP